MVIDQGSPAPVVKVTGQLEAEQVFSEASPELKPVNGTSPDLVAAPVNVDSAASKAPPQFATAAAEEQPNDDIRPNIEHVQPSVEPPKQDTDKQPGKIEVDAAVAETVPSLKDQDNFAVPEPVPVVAPSEPLVNGEEGASENKEQSPGLNEVDKEKKTDISVEIASPATDNLHDLVAPVDAPPASNVAAKSATAVREIPELSSKNDSDIMTVKGLPKDKASPLPEPTVDAGNKKEAKTANVNTSVPKEKEVNMQVCSNWPFPK